MYAYIDIRPIKYILSVEATVGRLDWCLHIRRIYKVAQEVIQYLIYYSITILETNVQKQRVLHGDLASVNQVFSMPTITFCNFFNTNCDVVDYSMAHILRYLVADLND
jgi:hypothetical protein